MTAPPPQSPSSSSPTTSTLGSAAPDALWTVLNAPTFRDRMLNGQFAGTIPSEEARRFPHNVGVGLLLQGDTLRGWAAAMTTDDPLTGAMSSYAELTRKVAAPDR